LFFFNLFLFLLIALDVNIVKIKRYTVKVMRNSFRTHLCQDIDESLLKQKIILCGWVHRFRDHGGILFVDLRDYSGFCQVVLPEELVQRVDIKNEFVVKISGTLQKRPDEMINTENNNGAYELHCDNLIVISHSKTLPFSINNDERTKVNEETRLKFRYLDLRRNDLKENLILRSKISQEVRKFLFENSFNEIETPILYKSTPEGARDYLVPSRVNSGSFYALPQSPQTLKQLLMISGFEKYFQIARCFRDEDLRADRQPEFTQIDIEQSFCDSEQILDLTENMIKKIWKNCLKQDLNFSFPRISYKEAMESYGSDKPDLRYDLKIHNVNEIFKNCEFKVFQKIIECKNGNVLAIPVRNSEIKNYGNLNISWTRKFLDSVADIVKPFGLNGAAWVKLSEDNSWQSPIAKFISDQEKETINNSFDLQVGDYVFFLAHNDESIFDAAGSLRTYIASNLGIYETEEIKNAWNFLWVTNFPLFEFDSQKNRLFAKHHPFTRCLAEDISLVQSGKIEDAILARAEAYDLVLNGFELGGGSLRIYDQSEQSSMFKNLGFNDQQISDQFGFFIDALKYGTPPHGGIALGLDRITMLATKSSSLRDVIAFPKTARAQCLMSSCPSSVAPEQMAELKISVVKK